MLVEAVVAAGVIDQPATTVRAADRKMKNSRMRRCLSVLRRSLPYPFIQERVRSMTQRFPSWIGEDLPLVAIRWSYPRMRSRSRVLRES